MMLINYLHKHPKYAELTYAEFQGKRGAPNVTPAHYYRVRKQFKDETEVGTRTTKRSEAYVYLEKIMAKEGLEAIETLRHERFAEESQMDISAPWFRRVRSAFLSKHQAGESTPPSPIPMDRILAHKIKELKALLTQMGYSSIRVVAIKKVDVEL